MATKNRVRTRKRTRYPHLPYRKLGITLMSVGAVFILGSLTQLLFGVPLSEGFAPAGLSLGPFALIAGVILLFSRRPRKGEKWVDDGIAAQQLNNLL